MKVIIILFSILFLLVSTIYYMIFLKDPHINWNYKLTHYIIKSLDPIYGMSKTFDRSRYYLVMEFLFKKKSHTNKEFIDEVLIEELTIPSEWKKDKTLEKMFNIKIFCLS